MVDRSLDVGWGSREVPPRALAHALARDRALYVLILGYLSCAVVAATALGGHISAFIGLYVYGWGGIAAGLLVFAASVRAIWVLSRDKPRQPVRHLGRALLPSFTPDRIAGAVLFLALCVFMGAFTTVKTLLPSIHPFWADAMLADLDRAIHFGQDPWRLLQPLLRHSAVTRAIEVAYSPGWLLGTTGLAAWMCIFCRDPELRARFLLTFLLCWILNGTVLAGALISGGPVYFGDLAGDSARFADQLSYIGAGSGPFFSAATQQEMLWKTYLAGDTMAGAGISAFPSLHVAMATLAALTVWSLSRPLGVLAVLFAGVILIGSVHLAWHYAVDGYVSIVVTLVLWRLSRKVSSRWLQSPDPSGRTR